MTNLENKTLSEMLNEIPVNAIVQKGARTADGRGVEPGIYDFTLSLTSNRKYQAAYVMKKQGITYRLCYYIEPTPEKAVQKCVNNLLNQQDV